MRSISEGLKLKKGVELDPKLPVFTKIINAFLDDTYFEKTKLNNFPENIRKFITDKVNEWIENNDVKDIKVNVSDKKFQKEGYAYNDDKIADEIINGDILLYLFSKPGVNVYYNNKGFFCSKTSGVIEYKVYIVKG